MKPAFLFVFLIICSSLIGQSFFSSEQFDEDQLKEELIDSINQKRQDKGLHQLVFDEILDAAAYEQAEYLMKVENFDHKQENSKFKTLTDRVEYFGGRYAGLGENIFSVQTAEDPKRRSSRKTGNELKSYADVISTAINAWQGKNESRENIYDPDFYNIGMSVLYDSVNKTLGIVAVFGTEAYPIRNGLKLQDDEGYKGYNRNVCDKVLREFPAIAELMGISVNIAENQVWLEGVDKVLLEKLLSNSSDALVADIICEDQFPCDGGNRLFPGQIHDGYLLKAVKKINLTSKLHENDFGGFDLLLGNLPPAFNDLKCEANILLIKENSVCAVAPFNHFGGKNISWLGVPYQFSYLNDSLQTSNWTDSLIFTFHSEANKNSSLEQLDSLLTYFGNSTPEIISAEAEIYYSPIKAKREKAEQWKNTLHGKLKEYSFTGGELKVSEKVAWEEYQEFVKNRIYSLETEKLDSMELISYLKDEYDKGEHLKTFMDSLNKIDLIIYKKNSWKGEFNPELVKMYRYFLQGKKPDLALRIQEKLIKNDDQSELLKKQIPLKKEYSDLANNQLLLQIAAGDFEDQKGKTKRQSFGEILFADPGNAIVQYNYLVATLEKWTKNLKTTTGIDDWLKRYHRINKNAAIPDSDLKNLLLNYHILAADHYYENAKYEARKKELEKVSKMISGKELSEAEANFYAEYLMFQLQLARAIQLLKPYALDEKPTEKTLRNILSISIYGYKELSHQERTDLYKKYSSLYPEAYCKLFDQENMGIQALGEQEIKERFCELCR